MKIADAEARQRAVARCRELALLHDKTFLSDMACS